MTLTILVSFSLLALVVTSRPILPVENLVRDHPIALRDVPSYLLNPIFRHDHEVYVRRLSAEEQNAYLVQLDDTAVKAVVSLSGDEISPDERTLGNSNLGEPDSSFIESAAPRVSVELDSEHLPFLPLDEFAAENDRSSENSKTSFTSSPLLVLTFSCIIALLSVLCVGVTLYITHYLRSKVLASTETLEMLLRFGKGNGEVGLPGDSRGSDPLPNEDGIPTGVSQDILAGGATTPLGLKKPEKVDHGVDKLVDLPDTDVNQLHEKFIDAAFEQAAIDPFEDPVLPLQYPVLTCEYPIIPSEVRVPPVTFEDNPWQLALKEGDHRHDKDFEEGEEEDKRTEEFHDVEDVRPSILITAANDDSLRSDEHGSAVDVSNPGQLYADPDLMPLPVSVPSSVSGSPVSAPSSPALRQIPMRESPQTSSPVSRPALSLRASDAPPLGVPSNTSSKTDSPRPSPVALPLALPASPVSSFSSSSTSPSSRHAEPAGSSSATPEVVPARRRAYHSKVPEFDIALAMQLRPGLGLGANPAWMVRFLMAMFGWLTILLTGKRSVAVKRVTTGKE